LLLTQLCLISQQKYLNKHAICAIFGKLYLKISIKFICLLALAPQLLYF